MNLPFFREFRRNQLRQEPFPHAWTGYLERNVVEYTRLSDAEQEKLRFTTRILVDEKFWEGGNDLIVTDEMKVTISALAAILTLGFENEYFPNVESIIVYADSFVQRSSRVDRRGIVTSERIPVEGLAVSNGPTILSWADAVSGGRDCDDGHNVVYHEFAHKLDFRDGNGNGVPHLRSAADYEEWNAVMTAEFEQLRDAIRHRRYTVIDPYGATNAAEFFAVTTEAFFERPVRLLERHERLYRALQRFYLQDPVARRRPGEQ